MTPACAKAARQANGREWEAAAEEWSMGVMGLCSNLSTNHSQLFNGATRLVLGGGSETAVPWASMARSEIPNSGKFKSEARNPKQIRITQKRK